MPLNRLGSDVAARRGVRALHGDRSARSLAAAHVSLVRLPELVARGRARNGPEPGGGEVTARAGLHHRRGVARAHQVRRSGSPRRGGRTARRVPRRAGRAAHADREALRRRRRAEPDSARGRSRRHARARSQAAAGRGRRGTGRDGRGARRRPFRPRRHRPRRRGPRGRRWIERKPCGGSSRSPSTSGRTSPTARSRIWWSAQRAGAACRSWTCCARCSTRTPSQRSWIRWESSPVRVTSRPAESHREREMPESVFDRKARVRPPRVHITYEVETGGAMVLKELPFVWACSRICRGSRRKRCPS